jgi:peptidyl-prolyl cis-trans isomerase SurA
MGQGLVPTVSVGRAGSPRKVSPLRLRRYLGLPLAAALLVVSACGSDGDSGDAAGSDQGSSQSDSQSGEQSGGSSAAAEPDLSDVPDVVAEVNGEELGKQEFTDNYTAQFQQASMQAQSSGQPVDEEQLRQQVVDNMVNGELLVQEAEDRGFDASQAQTDKALADLAQQNGMKSPDELVAALKKQGMDAETVQSQVEEQVKIDQLLAAEGASEKPTEKELRAFYDDLAKQQKQAGQQQKLPPFEKVRPQLEQQLASQQQSKVASDLVGQLRKQADIEIHV